MLGREKDSVIEEGVRGQGDENAHDLLYICMKSPKNNNNKSLTPWIIPLNCQIQNYSLCKKMDAVVIFILSKLSHIQKGNTVSFSCEA